VSDGPVTGVKDAAGSPFWFNGKVSKLFINPALPSPSGPSTYDGTARAESGLPAGTPKPYKIKFTKAGTYKYFCDVHQGLA
jgi:plastocyanin